MCPTCSVSKHPFAKTILFSKRRNSVATSRKATRPTIFLALSDMPLRTGTFTPNRLQQFGLGNRRSTALHHDQSPRDICDVCGLQCAGAAGKGQRVSGEHSVSGTCHIHSLVTSVYGNLRKSLLIFFKKSHPISPARHQKRIHFHSC